MYLTPGVLDCPRRVLGGVIGSLAVQLPVSPFPGECADTSLPYKHAPSAPSTSPSSSQASKIHTCTAKPVALYFSSRFYSNWDSWSTWGPVHLQGQILLHLVAPATRSSSCRWMSTSWSSVQPAHGVPELFASQVVQKQPKGGECAPPSSLQPVPSAGKVVVQGTWRILFAFPILEPALQRARGGWRWGDGVGW